MQCWQVSRRHSMSVSYQPLGNVSSPQNLHDAKMQCGWVMTIGHGALKHNAVLKGLNMVRGRPHKMRIGGALIGIIRQICCHGFSHPKLPPEYLSIVLPLIQWITNTEGSLETSAHDLNSIESHHLLTLPELIHFISSTNMSISCHDAFLSDLYSCIMLKLWA